MQNIKKIKFKDLEKNIKNAWKDRNLIHNDDIRESIDLVVKNIDLGKLRVATYERNQWIFHDWIRQAILLYFLIKENKLFECGDFSFFDKINLKQHYDKLGVRAVPPAVARYGSFINKGVILMPSYVNIGAYIDSGTMIDIGVCIGSCAQIGKNTHISAGVVIGGVLEPIQAKPVIIEDNVFVGANSIVVEGVHIEKNAVLAANVSITSSTKIIDTRTGNTTKGRIPSNSVVIPGSIPQEFPGGKFNMPCALILGERKSSTNAKLALNEILRF